MNTRIRYKQTTPGVYESVQNFLTKDGVLLKCIYDVVSKTIEVRNTEEVIVYTQPYTNVHAAKIILKRKLKEFGVSFIDEVRRKNEV